MTKIIWQDVFIIMALLFNLGAVFLTTYTTSSISSLTAVANNVEANPVSRILLSIGYYAFLIRGAFYAIIVGFYLYQRKNRDKDEASRLSFNLIVLFLFIVCLSDFVNDLGVVVPLVFH